MEGTVRSMASNRPESVEGLPQAMQNVAQLRDSLAQLHRMHAQLQHQVRMHALRFVETGGCLSCDAQLHRMHAQLQHQVCMHASEMVSRMVFACQRCFSGLCLCQGVKSLRGPMVCRPQPLAAQKHNWSSSSLTCTVHIGSVGRRGCTHK